MNEKTKQTCSRFAQPDRPNSQDTRDRPVSALHSHYTRLISPARYLAGECPSGCMIPLASTSGTEGRQHLRNRAPGRNRGVQGENGAASCAKTHRASLHQDVFKSCLTLIPSIQSLYTLLSVWFPKQAPPADNAPLHPSLPHATKP
jgi:hypothetical protein